MKSIVHLELLRGNQIECMIRQTIHCKPIQRKNEISFGIYNFKSETKHLIKIHVTAPVLCIERIKSIVLVVKLRSETTRKKTCAQVRVYVILKHEIYFSFVQSYFWIHKLQRSFDHDDVVYSLNLHVSWNK